MKAKLKLWLDRIDRMSLRERAMIFAMLTVVLVSVIVTTVIDPITARQKRLSSELAQTQAQVSAQQAQMAALVEAARNDPDAPNRQRLAELKQQHQRRLEELAGVKQGLVGSDRMAQALRDFLAKNTRLKLVSIKSLPASAAVALKPSADTTTAAAPALPDAGLYKHGIEISVEGGYGDLVAYLTQLESLDWRIYWSGAQLEAAYPVSRLTVTLYTLSLEKTWLAV